MEAGPGGVRAKFLALGDGVPGRQGRAPVVLVGGVFALTSPRLWVLAFLPIPLIVAGSIRFQRHLEPRYDAVRERVADLSSLLSGNLGGITTIKAFTAEEREADRLEKVSQAYVDANREAIRYSSAFIPLSP